MRRSRVVAAVLASSFWIAMAHTGAASAQEAFCGTYRGEVTNSLDPLLVGRVQVLVPDVSGTALWALPSVPFERRFRTPSVGQKVWVQYEACDPARPIWIGGFDATCVIDQGHGDQRCTLNP